MPHTKVRGTTHMDMNELSLFIFYIAEAKNLAEKRKRDTLGLQLRGARDSKALETMMIEIKRLGHLPFR